MPPVSASAADVAAWLTDDFIVSFERDVDPAIWTQTGQGHARGFFAITMLTLAYCDAMAGLIAGKSTGGTGLTVQFLELEVSKHAGTTAQRYKDRAAALFVLYRHRLAHQREPGLLDVDTKVIEWRIQRNLDEADHLRLKALTPLTRFQLTVDADRLNAHVRLAFRDIRERARTDAALAQRIFQGVADAVSAKPFQGSNIQVWASLRAMVAAPDP